MKQHDEQREPTAPVRSTDLVGGWRPIATAPKDRAISLWVVDTECWMPTAYAGSWSWGNDDWAIHLPFRAIDRCATLCPVKATHWRELPEAPTAKLSQTADD